MQMEKKIVVLSDGLKLEYAERGENTGVPVILLHGVTDSWRSFELVLPHLPESIHAFALSQRGHGNSDRPETGYRTREMAADVARFMDAVGVSSAVVVGHSMGSTHAMRFAIDFPDRVLGIMLVAAFCSYDDNPDVHAFWESGVSTLEDPVDPAFVREFQESTLAQPIPDWYLDAVVKESLNLPARTWKALFEGFLENDFSGELERISAPTLICWGDKDTFCRKRDQDKLLASIAGSQLVVYEGAGHALHWEEPVRFAGEVSEFAHSVSKAKPKA